MNANPAIALAVALTLACTACGSSSATTTPTTTAPTTTGSTTTPTEPATTTRVDPTPTATSSPATTTRPSTPAKLRGARYCEVLLLRPINGTPSAEVYNTYPLNDCPEADWKALDPATIAKVAGVPLAVLNGPRYWLMDTVEKASGTAPAPVSFGGIEMIQRATVDISSVGAGEPPYTPHNVNRKTVFGYTAGSTVYELVAPDGAAYIMQSWSQQVDSTLDEAALAQLAARLHVPSGWSYRARVLTQALQVVTTDTDAIVLQDELKNSYSKETER
jgi:hypothetical protein